MPTPVVLGLDFGGSKIACAVAETTGERVGTATIQVRPDESAQQCFDRGVATAHELLAELASGRQLVAVGACTFGIPRADGIDLAPNIAGWERLAFGDRMRLAFPGAELRIATDVKAAAAAEASHGALAGHDPALYLNLGTGLAAAIIIGGAVVAGRHGASGEIGYNLRHVRDGAGAPRLEAVIGGKALADTAAGLLDGGDVPTMFESAAHDQRAADVVTEFCSELAFHLVNLTIAIDPSRIAVGGGMVRSWPLLRPALSDALRDAVPFPPELVLAAHPFDAPLVGALDLAVDAAAELTSDVRREVFTEGAPA